MLAICDVIGEAGRHMLREISQTQKILYYVIQLWNLQMSFKSKLILQETQCDCTINELILCYSCVIKSLLFLSSKHVLHMFSLGKSYSVCQAIYIFIIKEPLLTPPSRDSYLQNIEVFLVLILRLLHSYVAIYQFYAGIYYKCYPMNIILLYHHSQWQQILLYHSNVS